MRFVSSSVKVGNNRVDWVSDDGEFDENDTEFLNNLNGTGCDMLDGTGVVMTKAKLRGSLELNVKLLVPNFQMKNVDFLLTVYQ